MNRRILYVLRCIYKYLPLLHPHLKLINISLKILAFFWSFKIFKHEMALHFGSKNVCRALTLVNKRWGTFGDDGLLTYDSLLVANFLDVVWGFFYDPSTSQ